MLSTFASASPAYDLPAPLPIEVQRVFAIVPPQTIIGHLKPMYDVLEGKIVSKSEPDVFFKKSWIEYNKLTKEQYDAQMKLELQLRAHRMNLGKFHQNLMGSFPHWVNFMTGHPTKCDIGTVDGSCVAEIKNNVNTTNSTSKTGTLKVLRDQLAKGVRWAVLVVVNGDLEFKIYRDEENPEAGDVYQINGRDFYHELSGSATFFDDLVEVLGYVNAYFETYTALCNAFHVPTTPAVSSNVAAAARWVPSNQEGVLASSPAQFLARYAAAATVVTSTSTKKRGRNTKASVAASAAKKTKTQQQQLLTAAFSPPPQSQNQTRRQTQSQTLPHQSCIVLLSDNEEEEAEEEQQQL